MYMLKQKCVFAEHKLQNVHMDMIFFSFMTKTREHYFVCDEIYLMQII